MFHRSNCNYTASLAFATPSIHSIDSSEFENVFTILAHRKYIVLQHTYRERRERIVGTWNFLDYLLMASGVDMNKIQRLCDHGDDADDDETPEPLSGSG